MNITPLTLSQLNRRVAQALSEPSLQGVWVVAELSDVRVNHGHCYMELMEKDSESGSVMARMRAVIWASSFARLSAEFFATTNQRFESGLKVLVCGSVNYHSAFGMSFVVTAIDPSYTMGEAERRRREIIDRLTKEGVIDLNQALEWPDVALRVAVISASGAAGYGDFINQLYTNQERLRFVTRLFPAVMQGDRTSPSVISALEDIAAVADDFDCVVIIRGGGATSDLLAFDDYNLALNVAQFPLPIIIGIGHERDTTVLDFVANMRVKTPTAAAEWLISRGVAVLDKLRRMASEIMLVAQDLIAGEHTRLAYLDSTLSLAPEAALQRAKTSLQRATMMLAETGARRISPEVARLEATRSAIATAAFNATQRAADRLAARNELLGALSPAATLARGYSITMVKGRAVKSTEELNSGDEVTTTFASGSITSIVNQINSK